MKEISFRCHSGFWLMVHPPTSVFIQGTRGDEGPSNDLLLSFRYLHPAQTRTLTPRPGWPVETGLSRWSRLLQFRPKWQSAVGTFLVSVLLPHLPLSWECLLNALHLVFYSLPLLKLTERWRLDYFKRIWTHKYENWCGGLLSFPIILCSVL